MHPFAATRARYVAAMASAGRSLDTLDGLMAELRAIDGLVVKGKTGSAFYFKSRAFLHFHGTSDALEADVRFGDGWERIAVHTVEQRGALVAAVRAHVLGPRP